MNGARALALSAALLGAGCGPSASAGEDAGARDAGPLDAPGRDSGSDAGFDRTALPPCTLVGPRERLALTPLVGSGSLEPFDVLERRAFYVLLVLRTHAAARTALSASSALTTLTAARETGLRDASTTCGTDAACVRSDLVSSATDLEAAIAATLAALDGAGLRAEIATTLRDSHLFERDDAAADALLLRTALTEALGALASVLDAYALSELAPAALEDLVDQISRDAPAGSLAWWEPLERAALLGALRASRDEGIRYEPLDTGENAAALAAISAIDWSAFPYAALLVPGQGPTDLDTALNPAGAARADLAAARWHARLAPLVVVSGGHVHPDRTRFSEAIEMKRYLITTHGLPESAILVDPYARHTTTNLRDVTRVLLRAGVATDARVLVVTDLFQTLYIRDPGFATRCDADLRLRPYTALEALSSTDTCMTMATVSLTADASDLLDP